LAGGKREALKRRNLGTRGRPLSNKIVKTYVVEHTLTKALKIGKSVNPISRLASLQTACPGCLRLVLVIEHDVESDLHKRFAKFAVSGEWFRPALPIWAMIAFLNDPARANDGLDYFAWRRMPPIRETVKTPLKAVTPSKLKPRLTRSMQILAAKLAKEERARNAEEYKQKQVRKAAKEVRRLELELERAKKAQAIASR
jgi:hypothetical protein